ncbi:MAG: ATP-binding protein, partial [Flavobacteriales bacterium]|nr:ATP-binding protein [Flavobacteriales bacterium]
MDALLSNASKFSHPGSDIEADLIGTPTEVELRIRDHGVGLSATDLAQMFVRFAWLNSRPTTGESQGRGTLARASGWAHAHGGSLSAESAGEGHGCTFTLRLPR